MFLKKREKNSLGISLFFKILSFFLFKLKSVLIIIEIWLALDIPPTILDIL